jgi:serine/threonine protein kinase
MLKTLVKKKNNEISTSNEEAVNNKINYVFQDFYEIVKPLGSGSFGEVYLIRDRINNNLLAAKFETIGKISRLNIEYKTYKRLHKEKTIIGIPRVYKYFQTKDYNVMLMDRLGYSLDDIFTQNNKKFNLPTVFYITKQILTLIEEIHVRQFIHRDIKPNNFMIGCGDQSDQIYILDFGLSKKYINDNQQHVSFKNDRSLIGTARYASINMHMGFEPSRRDDLESIGYMLIYFLKGGLPWQGLRKKKGKVDIKKIGEIKICTKLTDLCQDIPDCFIKYIEYCRGLKYDEDPDYKYIHNLFDAVNIIPKLEWKCGE